MLAGTELRRQLRFAVISVSVCAIVGVGTADCAEDAAPKFLVEIAPSQNATQPGVASWKVGAPVFVIVTRKNISDRTLRIMLSDPAFDYVTTVLDAQGRPVPETETFRGMKELHQRGRQGPAGRHIIGQLEPQEASKDTIELNYLYKLDEPGNYTVRVELAGEAESKSNILRITLLK
jgi:hypothetical protein